MESHIDPLWSMSRITVLVFLFLGALKEIEFFGDDTLGGGIVVFEVALDGSFPIG